MYILDTDVTSFYLHQPQIYHHLVARIGEADRQRLVYTSIVTAQELLAWRLNPIRDRPDQRSTLVELYKNLFEIIQDLRRFRILPFTDEAHEQFLKIGGVQGEIGTRDRRIAAIALAHDAAIVTNNTQHFDKAAAAKAVGLDLQVLDWNVAPFE